MNRPWLKFYPRDWRADPRLRMCSLAARGLWADMIGYMHEAVPYGHLLIDGKQPSTADLAALVGRPLNETRKAIEELGTHGVYSLGDEGTIFSRRMVRDCDRSEEGRSEIEARWGKPTGATRAQRLSAARAKGKHTEDEWNSLCEVFEYKCLRCGGEDIVKDHIKPVYQGGSDAADNLQPLCRTCNAAKGPDCTDLRESVLVGWRLLYQKRLGERLGREPKTSTQMPDTRSQKEERKNARERASPDFDDFWQRFPNKVGRQAALKAFEKTVKSGVVTLEFLLSALDRYCNKTDDRPWCNPATWLNQHRWNDQPAQVIPNGKLTVHQAAANLTARVRALDEPAPSDLCDRAGGGVVRRIPPR